MVTMAESTSLHRHTWGTESSCLPEFLWKRAQRRKRTGDICLPTSTCRYPNLISPTLGDRLGHRHFHLYWRQFPKGLPAKSSIFRTARLKLRRGSVATNSSTTIITIKETTSATRTTNSEITQTASVTTSITTDVKKVPFCSPAEIEGEKMFPKAHEVKCLKRRKRMLLDVFYHKLLT